MFYRLQKFAVGTAHLLLILLLLLAAVGYVGWTFACVSLSVSIIWLILTVARLNRLLDTYEDNIARMQIHVPMVLSAALACYVLLFSGAFIMSVLALGVLGTWWPVYDLYRRRRQDFYRQGYGPLPRNVWLNPPAEALREGDLILTDGRMARRTRNSVGHVELIIGGPKNRLRAFSSYMETGVVMHTARAIVAMQNKLGEHYIVLRLRQPFSPEQSAKAVKFAEDMLARNEAWREAETQRRSEFVKRLWLPAKLKNWLLDKKSLEAMLKQEPSYWLGFKVWLQRRVWPTGYDWLGQYTGLIHPNRWTCMGLALDLLRLLNVPVRHYGTGLLGLGTGLLNPLVPIRLMSDPCYRLLSLDDKFVHEAVSGNLTRGQAAAPDASAGGSAESPA